VKLDPSNKSICSYLWSSLCIRPEGRLAPCCIYSDASPAIQVQNINREVKDAYNSPFYRKLRENALEGKNNEGCKLCYFRDREDSPSVRKHANNQWNESFDSDYSPLSNLTFLEIFTGNLCNLKCLMCGPELSSSLAGDYVKLGWVDESLTKPFENDYRELLPQLTGLNKIKFVGGEPLLHKAHWELLASIPEDRARNIKLEYATNCTVFPNDKMLEQWRRFAGLEIFLSIDGARAVNEYIRFPSRWNIVEKNALKFRELLAKDPQSALGINAVVSNLNIFELDLLTEWVDKTLGSLVNAKDESLFFLNCLTAPNYLNIENLPLETKSGLLQKYPDIPHYRFVRAVLKSAGDSTRLIEFGKKINAFDQVRNISYSNYIPSLQQLVDHK
jgi:radical SAM protein with 4Fe4S-binding SPASM domain